MKITFAICTYNRLPFLKLVAEDFREQCIEILSSTNSEAELYASPRLSSTPLKLLEIELLLVDNNSNDDTNHFCFSFIESFNQSFQGLVKSEAVFQLKATAKYIFEKNQGLSYARNAAIKEALKHEDFDYLCFLDDDIRLSDSFLRKIIIHSSTQSSDFIASSRIIPDWEGGVQPSYINFEPPFALSPSVFPSHDYGSELRSYPFIFAGLKVSNPIGAVMIISKGVFERIGVFNTSLGVGSSAQGFGLHEDTEFFRLALNNFIPIYYWGDAVVTHPVSAARMSSEYICSWYFKSGKSISWLAFNRPELFPAGQAEMIGCPLSLLRFMPKALRIFLAMRLFSAPLYLWIKLFLLAVLVLLSYFSFNLKVVLWLRALMNKSLGEIDAFRILSQ